MPLGDPGGGNFSYTKEGLPETLKAVTIPVSDIARSVSFYTNVMKLRLIDSTDKDAIMSLGGFYVLLKKSQNVGIDTGIYMGVHDPFEFHRRMVDDGVVFLTHPERGPIGVWASFRDPDSNVIRIVEKESVKKV